VALAVALGLMGLAAPVGAQGSMPFSIQGGTCLSAARPWLCAVPVGKVRLTLPLAVTHGKAALTSFEGAPTTTVTIDAEAVTPKGETLAVAFSGPCLFLVTSATGRLFAKIYVGPRVLPRLPPYAVRTGDPAANIPVPFGLLSLAPEPVAAALAVLEKDQAAEHGAPFRLPRDFARLPVADQLFVLTNLLRITRGVWPLYGVSARLDAVALAGAKAQTDPTDPGVAFASNYANGMNPVAAMAAWFFDDGYKALNLDCGTPRAAGCWGHRRDILADMGPYGLFGAASIDVRGLTSNPQTAMIVELGIVPPTRGVTYTWSQAVAAGARPAA